MVLFPGCADRGDKFSAGIQLSGKKVVFNISVLPVVKIISAMFVHAFFVLFTIILYAAYGKFPDFYYLQIIYYSVCVFILVLGLSYATSAIVIFFQRSDPDHQHCASGRSLADSDHVDR